LALSDEIISGALVRRNWIEVLLSFDFKRGELLLALDGFD
jgi:hypothetical protein